ASGCYLKKGQVRVMKRLILFLAISLFCILPSHYASSITRCFIEPKSVKKALERSAAVFSGEVLAVKSGPYFLQARFRVERSWKGVEAEEVLVSTDGSAESPHYRVGEEYLVFAGRSNGGLFTGSCSRTKKLGHADADLQQLGEGKTPRKAE